jgi:hypothetical protein
MAEFITALSRFPVGHLVDLGAGHGIFARLAADLGWRVTAVDVRDVRFPEDPRVRWVTTDVRDFDEFDGVTVVACLGLWYHLTLADQLALIAKIAPLPVILDTHVARPDLGDHLAHAKELSDFVSEGAHSGRLYSESGQVGQATASWGNTQSFWPTPDSLERQFREAGYDLMERLLPPVAPDREYLVAQALDGECRQQLDGLVARYNPLRPEGEAAGVFGIPVTLSATRPTTLHSGPFSVRRLVSAMRRRTWRD